MNPAKRSTEQLATLLLLLQRARQAATISELGFLLVNETEMLTAYRQAVFWHQPREGRGAIQAVSNLPAPNRESPLVLWLSALCGHVQARSPAEPRMIDLHDLPEALAREWQAHLPPHLLWVPLPGSGGLLLAGDNPWSEGERRLLQHWGEGVAQSLELLVRRKRRPDVLRFAKAAGRKPILTLAVLLMAAALWLPVRLSVLAPAEVVAKDPVIVRAPLTGVIASVSVAPNQTVQKGQPLFRLDDRELLSRLEVAKQGLAVAQSEYRQTSQAAITSVEAKVRLAVLQSMIEQRRAEFDFVNLQLLRVEVIAEADGIVIFPDAAALRGRPVRLGERVMTLAAPRQVMLEAWVPPADSVALEPGAEVLMFLSTRPDHPLGGQLIRIAHQATLSPEGVFGFRAEAHFDSRISSPRIGLRGTAKLYGPEVRLAYLVFRRPWSALRQMTGW